jgi:hypothetical protein
VRFPFGTGWYDTKLENSVPCVFQAITPAWCQSSELVSLSPGQKKVILQLLYISDIHLYFIHSSQPKSVPLSQKNPFSTGLVGPAFIPQVALTIMTDQ